MGDMADMLLDQMDLYESQGDEFYTEYNKTCKYCGEGNLTWVETEKGWRLFDVEDKTHSCKQPTEEEDK